MTEQRPPGDLHDRTGELIEAYSLDALEPEEAAIVNAHLDEGCEGCEEEISLLRSIVDRIPLGVPLRRTPAVLKERVLREVQADIDSGAAHATAPIPLPARRAAEASAPSRISALAAPWRPARFASMAASVAILAAVGLVGWNFVLQGDVSYLDDESEALLATVATVEAQQREAQVALLSAQEEVADASARSDELETRMTAIVTVMGSDEQERVSLAGTSDAPRGAWGNILVNSNDGTFIILASGLKPGGEGGYVLWIHTEGGDVIPVSFFYVNESGNGLGYGKIDGELGEASITVSHEYDRSVRAPTGPSKMERYR